MKTLIILMLLLSLGACKKSKDSGSSKNPTPPPNNPTPEPPEPPEPPPTINEITSVQKIYRSGNEVEFVVTFSKAVEVAEGANPYLFLNVGSETRTANFRRESSENDKKASFFYEVQLNDNDDDGITLASDEIKLNGGSIQDTSGQDLVNAIPQEHQNFPGVKVDALPPAISSVATASGLTLFSPNAIVDLVATFNEPVKVTGVPSLILSVGGSLASANYQDKGESYSPTHTFRYIAEDNHSGSIQVTGLSVDSSHSISDGVENPMAEQTYPAPFSVGEITLEARSCDYTVTSGFNGGSGSESSPYLICTYAQLDKMRDSLTAHYELGQDIDASPSWSAGTEGCMAYDGSTVPETNACSGWVPVGTHDLGKCDGGTDDVCFQGHLDGAGYAISNLYFRIQSSTRNNLRVGFFGVLGENVEISYVGLVDINMGVKHTSTDDSYVVQLGGLAGNNAGTISNSYVTGNISGESNNFYTIVGGLVGGSTATISNSYATGTVSSTSTNVTAYSGGLVGSSSGTISNSYATGTVSSTSTDFIAYSGGLVGSSSGTISNNYATGTVSSSTSTSSAAYGGGLVGSSSGTISNNYATGTVSSTSTSGTAYGGGLLGYNSSGTISGTHYFVDSSGTNGLGSGTCSGTCTQKTLAELQALTSVTDWSTDDWDFGTTTQTSPCQVRTDGHLLYRRHLHDSTNL